MTAPTYFAHAYTGEGVHDGPMNKSSIALAASIIVAGESQLFGFTVFNTNAATQFIFVFDGTSVPANATPPSGPVLAVATLQDREFLWIPPRAFYAGIVIANSTSSTSFTAGAADCWFDVQYR